MFGGDFVPGIKGNPEEIDVSGSPKDTEITGQVCGSSAGMGGLPALRVSPTCCY